MAHFGTLDIKSTSTSILSSDATKVSPTVSTSYQTTHTLTVSPRSDEYTEITRTESELNANTITGVTLQHGASFQDDGASESANQDGGTAAEGAASTDCSNDTGYSLRVLAGSPIHIGGLGKIVTVRVKLKTSSVTNTTAMCARNAAVSGRIVRRVNQVLGGQFRGSF